MFFSSYDNDGNFKFDSNETKKVRRPCGGASAELKYLPLYRSSMILRMTLMVEETVQAVHCLANRLVNFVLLRFARPRLTWMDLEILDLEQQ